MTKPIIGITANVRPNPAHEDINWSYAPSGFVEGVQRAGGLAILLTRIRSIGSQDLYLHD